MVLLEAGLRFPEAHMETRIFKAAWSAKTSKTRGQIEVIVASLSPVRVLEANIDARPSKRKSEYPRPVTIPFDYLLRACRPKVVIAHGVDAVAYLQDSKDGTVIKSKHFTRISHKRRAEIIADTRAVWNESAFEKPSPEL